MDYIYKTVNGEKVKLTEVEIQELKKRERELKDIDVATGYIQKRSLAYPSMADQLDTIYHKGIDVWKADIKAIKDKYPKGG